tara:strand:+ start:608 stop:1012 length:405 start_codon:yes stop_codon:yes gene_type:complete
MSEELDEYALQLRDEEEEIKFFISRSEVARNFKEINQEVTESLGLRQPIANYSESLAITLKGGNQEARSKSSDHDLENAITFVTAKLYEVRDKTARGIVSASRKATNITASGNISASGTITATNGFGTIDGGGF